MAESLIPILVHSIGTTHITCDWIQSQNEQVLHTGPQKDGDRGWLCARPLLKAENNFPPRRIAAEYLYDTTRARRNINHLINTINNDWPDEQN